MGGIWVIAEQEKGELHDVSLEILAEAKSKLLPKLNEPLCAVLVGYNVAALADTLTQHGASTVHLIDAPVFESYVPELYADALAEVIAAETPSIVLGSASVKGAEVAARLAARLQTGLIPECVYLEIDDQGLLLGTKPAYGGKAHTALVCPTGRPQIATVKPGLLSTGQAQAGGQAEVVRHEVHLDTERRRTKVLRFVKADPRTLAVEDADVLVAGGRGIGSRDQWRLLDELALLLGGATAATRVAVDEGWVNFPKQIGQTGKTVEPRLYMAWGISGASHHTMGMKDSKAVVVVDKNRYAPMFKLADLGAVADLHEVLPLVIEKVRALRGQQPAAQ